jgi:hypothetical protein
LLVSLLEGHASPPESPELLVETFELVYHERDSTRRTGERRRS